MGNAKVLTKDMAIEYNAKLIEVRDNIKQLESLGIQVDDFNERVNVIDDELNEKVEKSCSNFDREAGNLFIRELLIQLYSESKGKLDRLNNQIVSEYEEYYKIQLKCETLYHKIEYTNLENLQDIVKEILQLFDEIKESGQMKYEREKAIVENVYRLGYQAIKLELIYTNRSRLLENAKKDEVDTSYLTRLIKEEIETLQNEELTNKISGINRNGFSDVYYLDEDLINLISMIKNPNFIKLVEDKIAEQVDNCVATNEELDNAKSMYLATQEELNEITKNNKKNSRERVGKTILLYVNMGLVGAGILTSIKLCKEYTSVEMFKTVTITYDTDTLENDTTTEYLPFTEDCVELIEYSPWEAPGYFRDEYTRNVYTYNLSNLDVEFEQPKDYLTTDIKDSISVTTKVETSREMPEDVCLENRYVVTKTTTAIMTYDTGTLEDETNVEYLSTNGDHVELIEYSPWEAPGYFRDEYTRNVYTYNLSNLDVGFEQPKDYLTTDIKDSISVTTKVETSREMPEDAYLENRYVVTKITQDKTVAYIKDRPVYWIGASITFSLLIMGVDTFLFDRFSKTTLKKLKLQKKENKLQISQKNQYLLDTAAKMNELTKQLNIQKANLEANYQNLPPILQGKDKIKKKMLSFQERMQEDIVSWKNS